MKTWHGSIAGSTDCTDRRGKARRLEEAVLQRAGHALRHVVLHREDVVCPDVEHQRPDVSAVGRVDQLRRDTQPRPGALQAALDQVSRIEPAADLACIEMHPAQRE